MWDQTGGSSWRPLDVEYFSSTEDLSGLCIDYQIQLLKCTALKRLHPLPPMGNGYLASTDFEPSLCQLSLYRTMHPLFFHNFPSLCRYSRACSELLSSL